MTETVSVGCKLPWGLICEMGQPGAENYQRVALVGSNGPNRGHGKIPGSIIAGGYGITFGVPKNFIDAWMAKHAKLDAVRNGLIFVEAAKDAEAFAKDMGDPKTGFEPRPQLDGKSGPLQTATED